VSIEHSGPICEVCGVLYVEEGDGQSCTEPGCVGVVSWAATADRLASQLQEVERLCSTSVTGIVAVSALRNAMASAPGQDRP
jgi:hypothetical protein